MFNSVKLSWIWKVFVIQEDLKNEDLSLRNLKNTKTTKTPVFLNTKTFTKTTKTFTKTTKTFTKTTKTTKTPVFFKNEDLAPEMRRPQIVIKFNTTKKTRMQLDEKKDIEANEEAAKPGSVVEPQPMQSQQPELGEEANQLQNEPLADAKMAEKSVNDTMTVNSKRSSASQIAKVCAICKLSYPKANFASHFQTAHPRYASSWVLGH